MSPKNKAFIEEVKHDLYRYSIGFGYGSYPYKLIDNAREAIALLEKEKEFRDK